jgi:hypothetical protein
VLAAVSRRFGPCCGVKPMDIRKVVIVGRLGTIAAIAATCFALPAEAQQTVISSPDAVRACLCEQQSVNRQAGELATRRQAYDEQRRKTDALVAEAASRKSQVDINDPAAIAAYSDLLGRRDQAVRTLADDATPRYSAFVANYNQRVARYNQQCPGQSFDATVLSQVRQTLSCPQE